MKNFEDRDSRPDREDADGGQERRPTYAAFMKDKRNKPASQSAQPRSDFSRGQGEEGQERRFDRPRRTDRPTREGSYRRDGERREGYRRPEQQEGTERRRSFNPNFDASNRFIGQPRSFRRSNEEGEETSAQRFDNRRQGDQEQRDDRRPSYPRRDDRAGRGDYRSDYRNKGERSYDKHTRENRTEERPARLFGGSKYDENRTGRYEDRKRFGNGNKPFRKGDRRTPAYDSEHYPTFAPEVTDGKIRLNRYIAMSGICSRREADEFIQSGVVTVNGAVVTELGAKVDLTDEIRFHGEVIRNERKVYIVMNKPKGYVTSVEDPHADKTVMDLVKNGCKERVYPVGRLDKNSLGVLLITNDGDMAKRLMHPSFEKKKVYQVSLDKPLTRADMDALVEGFELEDGEIHADSVSYVGEKKTEVGIEIHSGRNRIVRRMFEHLGYRVIKLDRVYFAGLTKQKLKRGEWRFLTPREVQALRSGQYE